MLSLVGRWLRGYRELKPSKLYKVGHGSVYCTKWTKVVRNMENDIPGLDMATPITLSVEEFN